MDKAARHEERFREELLTPPGERVNLGVNQIPSNTTECANSVEYIKYFLRYCQGRTRVLLTDNFYFGKAKKTKGREPN